MHKLKEKRGKKIVVHYFNHVTEQDGTKKHVYLGTDPEQSKNRLTKLRVARIRSDNKLIKDLDEAQHRLNRLGEYNRSFDDLTSDMNKSYYRQKHAENLLGDDLKMALPVGRYMIIVVSIILLTSVFYYLFSSPSITGAAVRSVQTVASNEMASTAFFLLLAVLIFGIIFRISDYTYRHKHDKYKRQK